MAVPGAATVIISAAAIMVATLFILFSGRRGIVVIVVGTTRGWWRRGRQFVAGQHAVAVAIAIGEQFIDGGEKFGAVDLAILVAIFRAGDAIGRRAIAAPLRRRG